MIIIGNLISSSREKIEKTFLSRNEESIKELALLQKKAGCSYINIFCGTLQEKEKECLTWAITMIQDLFDLPVSINSYRPEVLSAALKIHRGQAVLNSVSAKREGFEEIVSLISEYKPKVVVTCLDDDGIPETPEKTLAVADKILDRLFSLVSNLSSDDVFIEPVVQPLSLMSEAGRLFLESVLLLKRKYPGFKIMAKLENISYGLPKRKYINHAFLSNAIGHGVEVIMADPNQTDFWPVIIISELINNFPGASDRFKAWAASLAD